jgi:hypothetical protein
MPIYTVHGPVATKAGKPPADAIVFVRDGFSWPALVFGPFWLIWHRLWWGLLGYLVLMIVAGVAMARLGLGTDARLFVNLLISLLMGLEGTSLRRWTLSRRKWRLLDLVAADDRDAAEQRFFDRWSPAAAATPAPQDRGGPPPPRMPGFSAPPQSGGIIGLFPEPQGAPR